MRAAAERPDRQVESKRRPRWKRECDFRH
jgi:hypothetical protein